MLEVGALGAHARQRARDQGHGEDEHDRHARPAREAEAEARNRGQGPAHEYTGQNRAQRSGLEHIARQPRPAVQREGDLDDHPPGGARGQRDHQPVARQRRPSGAGQGGQPHGQVLELGEAA